MPSRTGRCASSTRTSITRCATRWRTRRISSAARSSPRRFCGSTGNSVLAMNLVALLSAALCGLGAYVLARQVGAGPAGAVVSGLVFAFSPPRFLRLDQLHLATIQWVPFGLASLHADLGGGRPFDLRLSAAFFTLQALSSGHGCAFIPRSGPAEAGHHLPGREG